MVPEDVHGESMLTRLRQRKSVVNAVRDLSRVSVSDRTGLKKRSGDGVPGDWRRTSRRKEGRARGECVNGAELEMVFGAEETEVVVEVKREVMVEMKSDLVVEMKSDVVVDVKSDVVVDVKSDVVVDVKSDVVVDVKSDVVVASKAEADLERTRCLPFYPTLIRGSSKFKALVDQFGAPTFGSTDVFTGLVRAIVWQQLSGYAAKAIWSRILAAVKYEHEVKDCRKVVLTPQSFDSISAVELRKCGLSQRKAEYVLGIVDKFRSDETLTDVLATLEEEKVKSILSEIRGVGGWTADMVLMFSLHRPDILPVGDLAVRKGAMKFFRLNSKPSEEKLIQLFEPFRPYRSYASWYMFRVCDPEFVTPA